VLLPLGEVIPFLNSNKYVIFLIYKQVNYLGIPYVIDGRSSAANSSIPSSSSGFPSSEPGAVLGIMGVEFCFRGVRSGSLRSYNFLLP